MDFSNISDHMGHKLQAVLPTVGASHPTIPEGVASIDLSNAENSLLAEEILPLAKSAIADTLTGKVL
jgi:hypothetical protein